MEKKVRYLMILLCLFLFPMKAFALEGTLEDTDDMVVVEENTNDENLFEEDLVKIENPNNIVLLGENSNNDVGDELDPTKNPIEEEEPSLGEDPEEKDPEEENPQGEEEPGEQEPGEQEPQGGEEPTQAVLEAFTLTGVNTDLLVGSSFSFGGTSGEPEKYSVVREEWEVYEEDGFRYASSDPTYNEELQANGKYIESIKEGYYYNYSVILKLVDLTPADLMTATINGETYDAYCVTYNETTQEAEIGITMTKQARNPNAVYIDSLDLLNVVMDAIAGKAPTYGASTTTEHFTLVGERWEYFTAEELSDGSYRYYTYANTSNESIFDKDYDTLFNTFDANNEYSYMVVVDSEEGYRLNPENEDTGYYKVNVDGEEIYSEVYGETLENGGMRYYIYLAFMVVPTVEEEEESTTEEPVATETTYYEEEYSYVEPVTLVTTNTKEKEDNKLEVRKDNKEKEDTEEKTTSSNTGLIVFLIILVIIAIAIPITIYKKKQ